jgi:hypothetical protein
MSVKSDPAGFRGGFVTAQPLNVLISLTGLLWVLCANIQVHISQVFDPMPAIDIICYPQLSQVLLSGMVTWRDCTCPEGVAKPN